MNRIIERVKQPIPNGLFISRYTTPVVYFGSYTNAKACTIALNPSHMEFYNRNGELLVDNEARLCSRVEIKTTDDQVLSVKDAEKVIEKCDSYFSTNPYREWFDLYDSLINKFGFSFYDKSCVHLDLVQWATNPYWTGLPRITKEALLANDLPFLRYLLDKKFEAIFLNGITVAKQISSILEISLNEKVDKIGGKNIRIFTGIYNRIKVIGWSCYLQKPPVGSYDNVKVLADILKRNTR